jgi:PAS domain S-box-containing protein
MTTLAAALAACLVGGCAGALGARFLADRRARAYVAPEPASADEEFLANVEFRYRTLVEQLPLATYIDALDDVSSALYMSPQIEPLLGYSPEEWVADRGLFAKLLHPDDRDAVLAEVARTNRSGERFACEYRLVARDGRVVWFRDESVVVRSAGGEPLYCQGYLLDITEGKLAEEELRRRGAALEAVSEAAELLLRASHWSESGAEVLRSLGEATNACGVWLFENRLTESGALEACRIDGWVGPGVAPGLVTSELRLRLDAAVLADWVTQLAAGKPVSARLEELPDPARSLLEPLGGRALLAVPVFVGGAWWGFLAFADRRARRVWSRAEVDALRAATGILGSAVRREVVEDEMRESEERFRSMADDASALIWVADTSGSITFFSRGWLEFTGRSAEEELGFGWVDSVHPDDRPQAVDAYHEAIVAGRPYAATYRLLGADGEYGWFFDRGTPRHRADGSLAGYVGIAIDVTEQKRAEQELEQARGALEAVVESSPLPIMTFDLDARVTGWNPAAEAVFGWREEEVLGKPNPLLPEGAEGIFARALELDGAGRSWKTIEAQRLGKDGTLLDVSISAAPLRDASGVVTGMVAMMADMSERKRAEEALATSEERLRTLIENIPAAVYRCAADDSWTMEFLSDDIGEISGYPAGDFIGNAVRSYASIIHPDDADKVTAAVDEGLAERRPFVCEYRIVGADGSERWVYEKGQPVFGPDGDLHWLDGAILDVTERKLVESELARQQELLDSIVENLPTPLFIKEASELRYVRVNKAAEELWGYARADLIGRSDVDALPPSEAAAYVEIDRSVLERQELLEIPEERIVVRGGGTRWVHTRKLPLVDPTGRSTHLLGISLDITDRKQAEEEREALVVRLGEQNERLLELDRMKDEFVALVSHELRTPLTSILGYLELIRAEEAGPVNEEQAEFLAIVSRNADRLLRLVGDLLLVAQIEAGKLQLEPVDIDLGHLIRDCLEAARPRAAEKGIELVSTGDLETTLSADRVRLAQVFDNLVSNAVKFTPEGGSVTVELSRRNGEAVVAVTDTGIGIPVEEQAGLFQRFFRTKSATRHAIQGTGLGLAITRAIAEAHGGSIEVESEEGAGTTFRVTLPLRTGAETAGGQPLHRAA